MSTLEVVLLMMLFACIVLQGHRIRNLEDKVFQKGIDR